MIIDFFRQKKHIILYGASLSVLLIVLNWLKLRLVIINHSFEIYAASIAVIFTGLGIWMALKLTKPKVKIVVVEKQVHKPTDFSINEEQVNRLNISKRELEVLQLMAQGFSNKEIANQLFVSVSTVKTHSNNLFDKMGVSRRTQAISQGKEMGIIP